MYIAISRCRCAARSTHVRRRRGAQSAADLRVVDRIRRGAGTRPRGFDLSHIGRTGLMDLCEMATTNRLSLCQAWAIIRRPLRFTPQSSRRCCAGSAPAAAAVHTSLLANGFGLRLVWLSQTRQRDFSMWRTPGRIGITRPVYRTEDGRWLQLMVRAYRNRRVIQRPRMSDLLGDPRFPSARSATRQWRRTDRSNARNHRGAHQQRVARSISGGLRASGPGRHIGRSTRRCTTWRQSNYGRRKRRGWGQPPDQPPGERGGFIATLRTTRARSRRTLH